MIERLLIGQQIEAIEWARRHTPEMAARAHSRRRNHRTPAPARGGAGDAQDPRVREGDSVTTAELVKRLMDAGATSEVVAIAIQAAEERMAEAAWPKRLRKRAELVRVT